jgi:hypothetical protein
VLELPEEPPPELEPVGRRLRQDCSAALNCGELVSIPFGMPSATPLDDVEIAESGKFGTPCERMHDAKAIPLCLAEVLLACPPPPLVDDAVVDVDAPEPPAAFGDPPPHAAKARASPTSIAGMATTRRVLRRHQVVPSLCVCIECFMSYSSPRRIVIGEEKYGVANNAAVTKSVIALLS